MSDADSPNKDIDRAIKKILKDIDEVPIDLRCKLLNTAIGWEKVKNQIREKDEDFDPDQL
jgi:hypothetical protein